MSLQACFFSAQEILHSTGAYLRQFLVDDKGCVLIACWGMPHLTYLDNAHRALSAAAQIRRKLVKQEMTCSFGITTGDVYCGTVGSALRMEYAAIGSVVNMSARLMCKANGGILVDDATHARLPASVTGTLQSLPPMKVKGRDEPLQVFAYVSTETVRVKEKVAEDHEIPVLCRDALLQLVDTMKLTAMTTTMLRGLSTAASQPGTPPSTRKKHRHGSFISFAKLLSPAISMLQREVSAVSEDTPPPVKTNSVTANPAPVPSPATTRVPLRIVLVKGRAGSGKTTVVKWLRKQAEDRRIATYSVRAGRKDAQTEYSVWTRLFHLMAPKGMFLSHEAQRSFVKTLLGEAYPDSPGEAQQVAFPVLKAILGFTCTYSASFRETRRSMDWVSKKFSGSKKALPVHQTLDVMHRVFAHLMNVQTSLFVLENVELCDECSLKLLLSLRKVVTNSGLVVTALDDGAAEETGGLRSFFHTRAAYHQEALKTTAWAREYERQLTGSIKSLTPRRSMLGTAPAAAPAPTATGAVTLLTLANYTPAEVDRMLCAALKVTTVPAEVSQLVQDFSGGSFFWVREILQFIQDHGPEQFLSAVGENESTKKSSQDDSHMRPPPRMIRSPSIMASPTAGPHGHGMKRGTSIKQLTKGASFRAPAAHRAAESPHQVQLNKLVLCRFGSLPSDVQRVLRTASIIGLTFTSTVLQGVVAPQLRDQLADHFQSLLNQRWLYQDVDDESLYQFAHPHAHQIIYELTPSSERASIHRQVAEHMERALLTPTHTTVQTGGRLSLTQHNHHQQPEDKAQYGLLSFHYQAGCEPAKALAYAAKAVDALLQQVTSIYDFGDCLDLLTGCVVCCNTPYDVDTMLTLVNRTRIAIREFGVGPKADEPPSCVSRFLATLSSFGASDGSGTGRVVPGGSSYEEGHARIGYDARPGEHSLHAGAFGKREDSAASIGAGSANSSNRSDSGARTAPITPLPAFSASAVSRRGTSTAGDGDSSDEKGAKRRFLQQVAVLYDDLSERYVEVTDELECTGATVMAPADATRRDPTRHAVREKGVACAGMDVPVLWAGEFGRKI
jgi:hypothetical protein